MHALDSCQALRAQKVIELFVFGIEEIAEHMHVPAIADCGHLDAVD